MNYAYARGLDRHSLHTAGISCSRNMDRRRCCHDLEFMFLSCTIIVQEISLMSGRETCNAIEDDKKFGNFNYDAV